MRYGNFCAGIEIPADHVERIELQLDRDALHQPLDGEIELRPAEAADEARRHLVGQHAAIDHIDIGDVVGAGHRAVHAIKRPRHRRAQERAIVFELIELEPENAALFGDRGLDRGDAVRAGARRDQMLDPVLDPFHRPAGDLRRQPQQHDIGKHRKLDAETAAGIRRYAQPQFRPRHPQRPRHHRMHRERALEIRQHVVAALGRIVLGDDDKALHRRERLARESRGQRDAMIGARERGFGVAIGEFAHMHFVGLRLRMQQRRILGAGRQRIDHRFERRIFDLDQLGGILGDIAAVGDHQRHRLADIAHPLDRQRPLLHRRLDHRHERIGQLAHVIAGDDRPHALMRQRRRGIDAHDLGMRMRRADHMRLQRADRHRQVVGIAAAARQQRRVLFAQDGFAELCCHFT